MRAVLCEDDKAQATLFGALLRKTAKNSGIKLELDEFYGAEALKIELEEIYTQQQLNKDQFDIENDKIVDNINPEYYKIKYDVYFLDIELGDDNGIELAKYIKSMYKNALIIFITSHTDYMQNAFDIHAYNYIVKPASEERLTPILKEINEMCESDIKKLIFKIGTATYAVPYGDIIYIQTESRYLNVQTVDGEYKFIGKMQDVESMANESIFGLSGKKSLFNFKYICKIEPNIIWYRASEKDTEKPFNLSRRYYQNFVHKFRDYVTMEKGIYKHLW